MENPSGDKKATHYSNLVAQARKLPLYKTSKTLLDKLIWYHVNHPEIYVSQKKLALSLKVGLRTIERSMKILYEGRYVIKLHEKSLYKTNRYVLNLAVLVVPFSQKPIAQKVAGEMAGNIYRDKKALRARETEDLSPPPCLKEDAIIDQSKVLSFQPSKAESQVGQDMIHIMEQETQGIIKPDERYRCTARKLAYHLKYHCGNDRERWRSFCKRVGSSNYLMGRSNGFVPPLLWLIKDEVIEKMRRGEFHRDFVSSHQSPFSGASRTSVQKEDNSSDKDLEAWLIRDRHKRAQDISIEENNALQKKFEALMIQENSWRSHVFKRSGWDAPDVRTAFLDFKINAVCGSFNAEFKAAMSQDTGMLERDVSFRNAK